MRIPTRARNSLLAVTALATATALAGCGGGGGGNSGGGTGGDGDDATVTIWSSIDQPVQDGLQKQLEAKAEAEDITIDWQKVENINQLIFQRIQANDTPDIAFMPQPGLINDIVERGAAVPIDDAIDDAAVGDMIPGTLETGQVDDQQYGLLVSMNVKSLVFYPKKAFEAAGYEAPTSIEGLNALTDQIKSDGNTPWCMGIESDTATGWPATDWFEDLVMRYGSAEDYENWINGELKFDSDIVREAAAEFEELLFTEGNVLGGRKSIPSNNFGTAGNPMFDAGGPGCFMYKQGSFIPGFFPDAVKQNIDEEVGVFGFPPAEEGGDNPVLGGGDLAVAMSDDEATMKAIGWLSEAEIGNEAAKNSTFISPHTEFDQANYPDDVTRQAAQVAYDSSEFLFDASDRMPGEVGSGSFWKEMTAWIADQQDLDTTLQNIDASYPQS